MFKEMIEPIIAYLRLHPHAGELIAFVVSFAESLPIIGTIIPGSITMTAVGTLIGASILPASTTLGFAALGAFCGDFIGYWLGFKYQEQIKRVWPFSKYPKWLAKGESFFRQHGGKSIIIGRFVGPARSTVPLVAGLLKLKMWRFVVAAIPSATLWALAYMVPGIMIGALSMELPAKKATEFIVFGLIAIVALWFIFWLIQYFFQTFARWINRHVDRLWAWLNHHHASKFVIRLITNQQHKRDHHQLTLILLALLSGLIFLALFANVVWHGPLLVFNQPLFSLLQSLHTHALNTFFILVTLFAQPNNMLITSVVVAAVLFATQQWRAATHFSVLIFLTAGATWFFKGLYHNPRPSGFMIVAQTSSFPSGHTILTTVLTSYLAFMTAQISKKGWHWVSYTLAGILIFLAALSRVYLGAHWLTDVLGSITLGFAILLLVIASYRRMPKATSRFAVKPWLWLAVLLPALIIPWLAYSKKNFQHAEFRYTPFRPVAIISEKAWWKKPFHFLPVYRTNRFGHAVQPFNIQWAAQLPHIIKTLKKSGWIIVMQKPTVKNTLQRLANDDPQYHMPVLPWQYKHRAPMLLVYKKIPHSKTIVELRLWDPFVQFHDHDKILWIGALNLHATTDKLLTTKRYLETMPNNGLLKKITRSLDHVRHKIIWVPKAKQPKRIQALHWNGAVLLMR